MLLKPLLLLAPLAGPALAADRIECSVKRYKLETSAEKNGDPTPTTPEAVLAQIEATPTLAAGEFFNVTDACGDGPSLTGDAADALETYLSEASAWSSRHACELKSVHDACTGVDDYSSSYLAPSVFCTSVLEAAEAEETCPASGVGRMGQGAGVFGALVVAVVAVAVGL